MKILTLRTDQPQAEIGLYENQQQLSSISWQAHRELAETIHLKISQLLAEQNSDLHSLDGLVVYQGPGSFTGLRIGITVANTIAHALKIPIVGIQEEDWQATGVKALLSGDNQIFVLPEYGALPNVSTPKK